MHDAIQVEEKYHAALHLFNRSQEQPKLECTPDHFLEMTHTQQHYENNEAFKKNESINQKPNPEEIKMSKNEIKYPKSLVMQIMNFIGQMETFLFKSQTHS